MTLTTHGYNQPEDYFGHGKLADYWTDLGPEYPWHAVSEDNHPLPCDIAGQFIRVPSKNPRYVFWGFKDESNLIEAVDMVPQLKRLTRVSNPDTPGRKEHE